MEYTPQRVKKNKQRWVGEKAELPNELIVHYQGKTIITSMMLFAPVSLSLKRYLGAGSSCFIRTGRKKAIMINIKHILNRKVGTFKSCGTKYSCINGIKIRNHYILIQRKRKKQQH